VPQPEFTDAARKLKYQGVLGFNVIVDRTGRISRVQLVRALGLGLEESAAETIRTWRFDPGKRNGEPVDVAIYIEVTFHLK
jgi:TonB family protein